MLIGAHLSAVNAKCHILSMLRTYHEIDLNGVVAKIPIETIGLTIDCDVIIL